ncbi:MAG: TaqI-like C-terminal specificity domain-containing protein [Chitinophagaceae bacterium]
MFTKEEAYNQISSLVQRFDDQLHSYKKSDYNETQTRLDFINPFFKALGWDVDNSLGNAEAYREVIHEDKLKIGGATKAPDYSFRLPGGKRLFFVEAKKPSVLVKEDVAPAYQVRRYGWNAKLPISLITDFEEFAVYDCTKKPTPADKASKARVKYLTYKQYLDEFDFIWNTFSKSSVLKGSFDKFAASDTNKKGTTTVDKEFLASLDEWRIMLAQNIALRNQALNEDELNFVVQQTLDRIIFLRIAEDRSVEPYGELQKITTAGKEEGSYFQNLFQLFKEADSKYNSGLFDFKKDTLSKNVSIDNKVIKTIVTQLYYPECPYEFSVLGVEILGSAYEQFLGKQIKLSPGHKAVIEEKPEVRKAGGVYYTPQYIVDYIVENTVGKKILELKPGGSLPEAVAKLKIVDPACGSGSFLIGAYAYLLNWHLEYYKPQFIELSEKAADNNSLRKAREDAIKQRNKLPLTPDGNLTTHIKKQILLNNIYGVDIDTQAVEVTKLSLLLKCMEGETGSSINAVMRFGERVLPTLDDNIKSGNSLIDLDFYDGEIDFEPGIEKKVKPFSWENAFPKIFKEGGFDCVIGNPPYVLGRETFDDSVKNYISTHYQSYGGKFDLYIFFCEKAMKVLNNNGRFSFIIPNTILTNENAVKIRELILQNYSLETIRIFNHKVFQNAQVETVIIVIENKICKKEDLIKIDNKGINYILIEKFLNDKNFKFNIESNEISDNLIEKIQVNSHLLGDLTDICIGIQLGGSQGNKSKGDFLSNEMIDETWKKVLDGKDINIYEIKAKNVFVNYGNWLHRKRDEKYFLNPKILIRQIGNTPVATLDESNYYTLNTIYNIISVSHYSLKYLLAIINSLLGKWFWLKNNSDFKTLFPKIKKTEIQAIPIFKINFENKSEKFFYDSIVQLVETMLQLHKEKLQTHTPDKLNQLEARIKYTDEKINQLVFDLYGLSEEERGIVESGQ